MEARIPVLWQREETRKGMFLSAVLFFKFGSTNLQLKQMIFDNLKKKIQVSIWLCLTLENCLMNYLEYK